jgi:hemerythrin-like domain-containing protein
MTQTLEKCREFTVLKEFNPRLTRLVDELQEWMARTDPERRHLEMEVASLFEVMTQQFDREERGHLFRQVIDVDPSLAECAEGRHHEHLQLVERMECIRAAFERTERERRETVDEHLNELIQDFLDAWREHERKEAQLLRDALKSEVRGRSD